MAGWSKPDTLAIMEEKIRYLLGDDLYKVLESGKVKTEVFGLESSIDLLKKQASVQKKFGKGYQFNLDINKPSRGEFPDVRMGITKKF